MTTSILRILSLIILMLIGFYLALSSIISLSYISDNEDLKIPISKRFDSTFKQIDTPPIKREIIAEMQARLSDVKDKYFSVAKINLEIQGDPSITDSIKTIYNKQVASLLTLLTKQITLLTNEKK